MAAARAHPAIREGSSASVGVARPRRSHRSVAGFEPLEAKLRAPGPRPDLLRHPALIARLLAAHDTPVVLVAAPPGYGKTTLLAQWREEDQRPFAWVTLDDTDNDPAQLLMYIVGALDGIVSLDAESLARSYRRDPSFIAHALPRLTHALGDEPFVLVLDDMQVLTAPESLDVLWVILEHLPKGAQLVLSGRDQPPAFVSRLLATESLLRVGPAHLAMTPAEGGRLLRAAGVAIRDAEAERLVGRTEGWPAGLRLAALSLRDQDNVREAAEAFTGNDGPVSEYFRAELLDRIPPDLRDFLYGTAALDHLSGPLCDALLQTSGSAAQLERLEQANAFVTPLDRKRVWYRRHQLFAEMLASEVWRHDPELLRVQHERASTWFESQGDPETALAHARAAGDMAQAGGVIARNLLPSLSSGRAATVRRWIDTLPAGQLGSMPWFAAAAAVAYVPSGDLQRAAHWLAVADRGTGAEQDRPLPDGRASLRSAVAISRALLGLGGVARLGEDASLGYELESKESAWRTLCAFLLGVARHLQGNDEEAVARLQESVDLSAFENADVHAFGLAELAVIAAERKDWEAVRQLSEQARREIENSPLRDYALMADVYAVSAVSSARWHQPADARKDAVRAVRLLASLSEIAPWMNAEGWILVSHAYLLLGDVAASREALRNARRYLLRLPDAPVLHARFDQLSQAVATRSSEVIGPPLTAAEIRVLQYLPTHLSFREIASRLYVSRNTVKTQVISAYRKLGVSSRTDAVASARALALIDDDPTEFQTLNRAS